MRPLKFCFPFNSIHVPSSWVYIWTTVEHWDIKTASHFRESVHTAVPRKTGASWVATDLRAQLGLFVCSCDYPWRVLSELFNDAQQSFLPASLPPDSNFMAMFYSRPCWEIRQAVKCAVTSIARSSPRLCSALTYSWAGSTKCCWHLSPPSSKVTSPLLT